MKSRKINETAAREITTRITNRAFEAEKAALAERKAALSAKAATAICPEEQAAIIRSLPAHLKPAAIESVYVETDASNCRLRLDFPEVIFCNWRYVGLTELGPDLHAECCMFNEADDDLERRQRAMAGHLLANIRAASTTGKLIEAWPETEEVVADYYGEALGVETPLATLLGRYLSPALPAPQPVDG